MGTLYLVATPIGNLEDISHRALRVLSQVRCIAAEDTRQTRKLLSHYNIRTAVISFHEHSPKEKLEQVLKLLDQGDVALVSDAGTPLLNDPGVDLVLAAIAAGHTISPIPGPSAPLAALIASGLPVNAFLYLGYLPRRMMERRRMLTEVKSLPYTLVFLETPHRLLAALSDLKEALGDRHVAVARELTKLHEEIFRGTLSEAFQHYTRNPARGEITLVVAGYEEPQARWSAEQLQAAIEHELKINHSSTEIASRLASESGWPRREIYRRILERRPNFRRK